MNSVELIGRLTADPRVNRFESNYGNSGVVANFSLAVERPRTKDRKTDYIPCVAWGKSAEFVEKYLKKGTKMGIHGMLTQRNFKDKDGNTQTRYEVLCYDFDFCESKYGNAQAAQAPDSAPMDVPAQAPVAPPPIDMTYGQTPSMDVPGLDEVPFT